MTENIKSTSVCDCCRPHTATQETFHGCRVDSFRMLSLFSGLFINWSALIGAECELAVTC